MPIFEYRCKKCNAEFEKLVFRSDDTDIECPACKSHEVEKKMSAASVVSSGGGFGGSACSPVSSSVG